MDPKEHQLSEEEINTYGKELDELFQSLVPLLKDTSDNPAEEK
jgi:hypothetical protein